MQKIGKFTSISLIIVFFASSISLSADETAEELLNSGLSQFRAAEYNQALLIFTELANLEGDNPYIEESLFLLAKTNIRMGKYDEVLRGASYFISAFPESIYMDDMVFMLAEVFYFLGNDEKAFSKLFRLLENDVDPGLRSIVEEKVRRLLNRIDRSEIERLYSAASEPGKKIIDEILEYRSGFGKIILLTAPDDSTAMLIEQGVRVAMEVFKDQAGTPELVLDILPADDDYLGLYLKIKSFDVENYGAVISLLKGTASLIAAAAASHTDIPFFMLSDDSPNIWETGDNIWQLVPDMKIMGSELADFIVDSMGLERVVTLAAMNDSRSYFADAFIQRAEEKEIEIIAQEWYYTDALDLGKNFKMMRQSGFRCTFDDSLKQLIAIDSLYVLLEDWEYLDEEYLIEVVLPDSLDSLLIDNANTIAFKVDTLYLSILSIEDAETDSIAQIVADQRLQEVLDKAWRAHQNDIVQKARFQRIAIDSTDIPLSCFDGFIFPLRQHEIDMFIPQFAFYNFNTSLFSLRSAFTQENIEKYRQYLGGLKTVGWGNLRNYESPAYSLMLNNFINLRGHAPSDEEVLGYDAANFILSIMPDLYNTAMLSTEREYNFSGVYHDFFFPEGIRGNRKVDFFEFDGRGFKRLAATAKPLSEAVDNQKQE